MSLETVGLICILVGAVITRNSEKLAAWRIFHG